jgi:hypothetical protein
MAVGKTMYPADWSGEELAIEPVERLPPGGSNTVQDLHSTGIPNAHGTLGRVLLHTVFDAVGIMSGEHLFGGAGGGVAGGVIGTMGGEMSNDIRMAGITRVNDLVTRALLEPDVAKALLQRIPANGKVTPQSPPGRALLHALAVGTVGSMVPSRSDNRRPPMLPPVSGSRSKGYTPPPMRLTPVSQAPQGLLSNSGQPGGLLNWNASLANRRRLCTNPIMTQTKQLKSEHQTFELILEDIKNGARHIAPDENGRLELDVTDIRAERYSSIIAGIDRKLDDLLTPEPTTYRLHTLA